MNDRSTCRAGRRIGWLRRPAAHALPVVCLAAVLLWAAAAGARVYKYLDRNGDAHYTDSLQQVPLEYRNQVRDISPEMQDMTGLQVVPGQKSQGGSSPDEGAGTGDLGDLPDASDLADLTGDGGAIAGLLDSLGFGVILLALLLIPVFFVVSALIFRLACRLAGEEPPGLGWACVILLAQGLAGGAVGGIVGGVGGATGIGAGSVAGSLAVGGLSSLLSWMVNAGVLVAMAGYGFLKSMWIGFLHNLLAVVMIGVPIALVVFIGMLVS